MRQVYDVTGTALAKTLSGSLELILKNKNNKTATALGSDATERCLQSFLGVLCALCPCPSGDSRDTTSTSEAGRRLGDVCIVALPVLCPGLGRYQLVREDHTVRSLGIRRGGDRDDKDYYQQAVEISRSCHPHGSSKNVDCTLRLCTTMLLLIESRLSCVAQSLLAHGLPPSLSGGNRHTRGA